MFFKVSKPYIFIKLAADEILIVYYAVCISYPFFELLSIFYTVNFNLTIITDLMSSPYITSS